MWFPGNTIEEQIQNAINAAAADGAPRVLVHSPYSATLISFNANVQMVREGGDWSDFDVEAYGATGDAVTVDAVAIKAAITAATLFGGGDVTFPSPTYNLGNRSGGETIFDTGSISNIRFIGPTTLLVNTTDQSVTQIFYVANPQNVEWRNIYFRDTGTSLSVDWKGSDCIRCYGTGAVATYNGVRIIGCRADNVVSFVIFGNTLDTDARIRDIRVEDCIIRNSYYGVVCQENGDGLRGNWRCENVRRAYFPYGVTDHSVEISITHDGVALGANSACLIKRYKRDTKNISVKLRFYGSVVQYGTGITLEHQPIANAPSTIEDIDIDLHISENIVNNNSMVPFRFRSYTDVGVEETVTTANRWDKVSLRGSVGKLTGGIGSMAFGCAQTTEGRLYLDPSIYVAAQAASPHYPGFVVRIAHDREFRTLAGSLTTQTLLLPFGPASVYPSFDANAFTIRVIVYAHDDKTALAAQNSTLEEDVIIGYNASGGGAVGIQVVANLFKVAQGNAVTVVYTASGENIAVTFTGASYNNANAFARVETQYVSRGPLIQ